MNSLIKFTIYTFIVLGLAQEEVKAQEVESFLEVPLWDGNVSEVDSSQESIEPTLTFFLPDEEIATGAAVVVCPGGGYSHLAIGHEGYPVAEWLNKLGIAAFILKYRRGPAYQHPVPLNDAQRAIRIVRSRADELGIDTSRIGILGFSAGGHLASTAGTHFDQGDKTSDDPIERVSSRPDFMVLIYPVISMKNGITHPGSRRNLLGENPDPSLVWLLSNEMQITPEIPPAFLIHTTNDRVVPVENSILFYQAMVNAGIPVEMHIFEQGPHGFGLAPEDPVLSGWVGLAEKWLVRRGIIEEKFSAVGLPQEN